MRCCTMVTIKFEFTQCMKNNYPINIPHYILKQFQLFQTARNNRYIACLQHDKYTIATYNFSIYSIYRKFSLSSTWRDYSDNVKIKLV